MDTQLTLALSTSRLALESLWAAVEDVWIAQANLQTYGDTLATALASQSRDFSGARAAQFAERVATASHDVALAIAQKEYGLRSAPPPADDVPP